MGVLNRMHDSTRRDEHGVVLVISLLMLVLLSILGILVINLSATNIQTAAFEKLSTQSFSGAESGLTQARSDMQGFVILGPQNGQWPAADNTVINTVMALPPAVMGRLAPTASRCPVNPSPLTTALSISGPTTTERSSSPRPAAF